MNIDCIRVELERLERRARERDRAAFVTMSIWPTGQNCGPSVVNIHMLDLNATADTAAGAIAHAGRLLDDHDPEKLEAEGWAIIGGKVPVNA